MERSYSLYHFLMSRFGAYFGIALLAFCCIFYVRENTTKEDLQIVSLLQETRYRIDQASKSSVQYLRHGKSKELDEYNLNIVQMGKRFSDLAVNLKKIPEMQGEFAEIQKKTRVHFLEINAKLEKKQNGRFDAERGLASISELGLVLVPIRRIRDSRSPNFDVIPAEAGIQVIYLIMCGWLSGFPPSRE